MKQLFILSLFVLALTPLAKPQSALGDDKQPNIVFIFADDQRYNLLGCYDHPIIKTPRIDALAQQGTRFDHMYVTTAVCWVSRAVILTGQWARSYSGDASSTVSKQAMQTAYPKMLSQAGYRTGFYGKWHTKSQGKTTPENLFDESEAISRHPYLKPQPDGSTRHEVQLITDRGLEFINRNKTGQPFYLSLWFNSAHAEDGDRRPGYHYQWPETTDGMYEDITIPQPRLGDDAIYEAHPEFLKQSINRQRYFWSYDTPEKYQVNLRAYYRMISGIDHEVGRVVDELKKLGLDKNTIIVYAADNGYYLAERGFQGKWSHFNESMRVPLIVYDPRQPTSVQGQVNSDIVLNVDLPKTFLDWAGATIPESYQGESIAPLVAGQHPLHWRTDFFAEHLDLSPTLVWEGVISKTNVYARYVHEDNYEFLHDLSVDPDELVNFSSDPAHADELQTMRNRCNQLRAQLGPEIPPRETKNKNTETSTESKTDSNTPSPTEKPDEKKPRKKKAPSN